MLDVHPKTRELLSRGPFALRNLVLVMREDQIDATGVDVDGCRAEQAQRHRRALNVPPGTTGTNARVPRRLPFLGRFPQDEVARVFLVVLVRVDPRAALDP